MNTPIIISAIVIVLLLVVVGANVLIYKIIRRRVLKLYVIPFLKIQEQEICKAGFTGLFDGGNYGKHKLEIKPVAVMGNIINDTYINIYVKQKDDTIHRYTTKITTIFMYIKRVELKGDELYVRIKRDGSVINIDG